MKSPFSPTLTQAITGLSMGAVLLALQFAWRSFKTWKGY